MFLKKILKTENIIKILPDETLSSALGKLSSAHDAAFVFSQNNEFLGVINPYHCLIKSSYPYNTKVSHCLFHPPRVYPNYPIKKVAQLLTESKIHYLPVFDDKDKFIGIISARHFLEKLSHLSIFKIPIKEIIKKKRSIISVYEDSSIAEALNNFKLYKVSKLIVINHQMKLRGILSYYDLISYLITPKTKEHKGDRVGNKIGLNHLKVINFAKTFVLTLRENELMEKALNLILEKKIGSVVIIDKERHPIGIITTKDLLNLFIKGSVNGNFEIIAKDVSKKNRQILGGFFNRFQLLFKKQEHLSKAKLIIKEQKKGGLFEGALSLVSKQGKTEVIKREEKNLPKMLTKFFQIVRGIKDKRK
ncbi:MAG: CBS domain-containing protein [Patescibacteria group bacterium]|nr:CBS domain-containing protein [Patescibacteria group bacterium]